MRLSPIPLMTLTAVMLALAFPDAEATAAGELPVIMKDPSTGMAFVFVKGGCYLMGDTFGVGSSDEKPAHEVCVSDFYMGVHEVTQRQWEQVMGNNPSFFKRCGPNCPVENVSWPMAQEFVRQLSARSGRGYRLPTEAEWEYAARSGGKNQKWAGTNDDTRLRRYAWYVKNSGGRPHRVGLKKANRLGLHDMSGNVWEWCQDWYLDTYYEDSPRLNPRGAETGTKRIVRGGSWRFYGATARVANRVMTLPENRLNCVGFRLVLPLN